MNVLDAIKSRRSIRKYKKKALSDELIKELLECARLAPSGHNKQPWKFIVIKNNEKKNKLASLCNNQTWMTTAPVFIACIADMSARCESFTRVNENSPEMDLKRIIRDTAIATEHIVLGAQSLGLGSCYVAWFKQDEIRPVLGLSEDKFVVAILTIGYKDEFPKERSRKKIEEICSWEN